MGTKNLIAIALIALTGCSQHSAGSRVGESLEKPVRILDDTAYACIHYGNPGDLIFVDRGHSLVWQAPYFYLDDEIVSKPLENDIPPFDLCGDPLLIKHVTVYPG